MMHDAVRLDCLTVANALIPLHGDKCSYRFSRFRLPIVTFFKGVPEYSGA